MTEDWTQERRTKRRRNFSLVLFSVLRSFCFLFFPPSAAMEFAARLFALIRKDLPFMEYAGEFCGLAAVMEVQDSALLHLFRLGACYHRPIDLPDTTGLTWREGIYRCLGSVRARARTSLPLENMASPLIINRQSSPVPAFSTAPSSARFSRVSPSRAPAGSVQLSRAPAGSVQLSIAPAGSSSSQERPPVAAPASALQWLLHAVPSSGCSTPVPAPRSALQCRLPRKCPPVPLLASALQWPAPRKCPPVPAPRKCPPVPAPRKCPPVRTPEPAPRQRSQVPAPSRAPSGARASRAPPSARASRAPAPPGARSS